MLLQFYWFYYFHSLNITRVQETNCVNVSKSDCLFVCGRRRQREWGRGHHQTFWQRQDDLQRDPPQLSRLPQVPRRVPEMQRDPAHWWVEVFEFLFYVETKSMSHKYVYNHGYEGHDKIIMSFTVAKNILCKIKISITTLRNKLVM